METGKTVFDVDEDLKERLKKKYSKFTGDFIDFDIGHVKIRLESKIYLELLKVPEDEAKESFMKLCLALRSLCYENDIQLRTIDLYVLTDDEIDRGLHCIMRDSEEDSGFGVILISLNQFKLGVWMITFLHELTHCWLPMKQPDSGVALKYQKIATDLIALCAFRRLFEPHKRLYREVIKHGTCFGSEEAKNFLGKDLHREILENPESHLKKAFKEMQADSSNLNGKD
jgi:hypothetical protein